MRTSPSYYTNVPPSKTYVKKKIIEKIIMSFVFTHWLFKWSNEKETKKKSAVNRWVQVKNPDLIVRRGEVFFYKSKTCSRPSYHQQTPYRFFAVPSGTRPTDLLPSEKAEGHPTQITQQNSILQENRCQCDRSVILIFKMAGEEVSSR